MGHQDKTIKGFAEEDGLHPTGPMKKNFGTLFPRTSPNTLKMKSSEVGLIGTNWSLIGEAIALIGKDVALD